MGINEILEGKREQGFAIVEQYGVRNVSVFRSVARADENYGKGIPLFAARIWA